MAVCLHVECWMKTCNASFLFAQSHHLAEEQKQTTSSNVAETLLSGVHIICKYCVRASQVYHLLGIISTLGCGGGGGGGGVQRNLIIKWDLY